MDGPMKSPCRSFRRIDPHLLQDYLLSKKFQAAACSIISNFHSSLGVKIKGERKQGVVRALPILKRCPTQPDSSREGNRHPHYHGNQLDKSRYRDLGSNLRTFEAPALEVPTLGGHCPVWWAEPVTLLLAKLIDKRVFATTECHQHQEKVLVEPQGSKILQHWSAGT